MVMIGDAASHLMIGLPSIAPLSYVDSCIVKAGNGSYRRGARRLKRNLLGLCGQTSEKSEEELLRVLQSCNAVSSYEEARGLLGLIDGKRIVYDKTIGGRRKFFQIKRYEQNSGRPDFYAVTSYLEDDAPTREEWGRS